MRANALSNTLYFRQPSNRIIQKYSLATMRLHGDGKLQDFAHVVVMPHVNRPVIDQFLSDLAAEPSI
jgi:histidine decarboxylase